MNLRKVVISIGALTIFAVSQAQVVSYSSFVGGSGYDLINQGVAIQGPDDLNPIIYAFQFTASVGGSLSSVRVPTSLLLGSSLLSVSLLSNNTGDLIGSSMKSWQFEDTAGTHINTLNNADSSVILDAGTKYWLLMAASGNGVHFWGRSQIGGLMYSMFSTNGLQTNHYGNSDVFSAYEVNVNPVPEPASLVALGLGLSIMVRKRKIKLPS